MNGGSLLCWCLPFANIRHSNTANSLVYEAVFDGAKSHRISEEKKKCKPRDGGAFQEGRDLKHDFIVFF